MKKNIALLMLFAGLTTGTFAQKFAIVDTKYILDNIPEFTEAQKQIDDLAIQWQKEIEAKYAEIDRLYKQYQSEQVLLTEDMRRKREDEIIQKEKEVKEFQKSKFGPDGELAKKSEELIKPIQDKVYNAIKEYAELGNYAVIFDKSLNSNILYNNDRYDKSDEILKKLGITPSK
ncbi:MAG: OmpH family outer membrane protein [Bacteroidetes bacterium]|nr:MAG: OmpH family outer membrane protein [Bacteroidota bacterium]